MAEAFLGLGIYFSIFLEEKLKNICYVYWTIHIQYIFKRAADPFWQYLQHLIVLMLSLKALLFHISQFLRTILLDLHHTEHNIHSRYPRLEVSCILPS